MNGQEIKALRTALGLSQQAFSEKMSVTTLTVGRWENHEVKPSKLALMKLQEIQEEYERNNFRKPE